MGLRKVETNVLILPLTEDLGKLQIALQEQES